MGLFDTPPPRFRYTPPWDLTYWGFFLQRFRGCDEHHNKTFEVVIPLVGAFTFWRTRGHQPHAWGGISGGDTGEVTVWGHTQPGCEICHEVLYDCLEFDPAVHRLVEDWSVYLDDDEYEAHIEQLGDIMGLDTTHNCWHGAYSLFEKFRGAVAVAAHEKYGYTPDYQAHPHRAFMGWWDRDHDYTDILDVFFVHSDCDGYIFPQHADELATKLRGLLPLLDGEGPWSPRVLLQQFINGLLEAANQWQIIEFR